MSLAGSEFVKVLVRGARSSPLDLLRKSLSSCSVCGKPPPASRSPHHKHLRKSAKMSTVSSQQQDQNNGKKKMTICVEGNIGSGKTMLLDYFASHSDKIQVLQEPVNMWRNVQGHNMLGLLYEDPVKWSFPFQSYVQLSMLSVHQIPHTHPLKIMERSIFSAKYCFVENLHQSGKMSDPEYAVITEWFTWLINSSLVKVDQFIYLRASPEYCYRRIQTRHRHEETGISMDYLHRLDELHEDWLIHQAKFPLPAPVMVIDANRPVEEMLQYYKDHRADILTPYREVLQT